VRTGRRWLAVACVAAVSALTLPAAAKPARELTSADQPAFEWERPFAVNLHLSTGGPFRGFSVSYEVAPIYFLPIEVGVSPFDGVQFGAMARLRLPARSMAFALGAGLSRGPRAADDPKHEMCLLGPCIPYSWKAAVSASYELSLSRRWSGGFQWRLYGGYEQIINRAASDCGCARGGLGSFYFGTALGYAFFL